MRTLVTGGSGFIASHLVEALTREGHRVTVIDVKPSSRALINIVDVSSSEAVDAFFKRREFDVIYHLAAKPWAKVTNETEWIKESQEIFNVNAIGTYNLIKNCGKIPFIFSSTSNLYGHGRAFTERSPVNISSPYGYSKYVAEHIIYASMIPYTIYRFGTVVGRRGRCFPNRLVWCAINNVPVEIFNNGDTYRDIIDVRDIVSALLVASKLDDDVFNISCGTEVSGRDLATLVDSEAQKRGYALNYKSVFWKASGYVPYSSLNISKILDTRAWKPKFKLKETIEDLFDYYEQEKEAPVPPRWDEI